jgi:hypothetical protein
MNRPPHAGDVLRVHPGVLVEGRDLGGIHLTVKATTESAAAAEFDATEVTGGRPIHLLASDVDLVYPFGKVSR